MAPRKRNTPPLSAFDPRFKELLLRGSRERFFLSTETQDRAVHLRQRIQQFRFVMKEHHKEPGRAEWEPLYGCVVTLAKDGPPGLNFIPRSQEFDDVISGTVTIRVPSLQSGDELLASLEAKQSTFTEETCPGHIASDTDPKICGRCGTHIDSLR